MTPQKAKTLMIQGTASSVGKSLMVAALCRIFKQDGRRVAPFKAQNMALNSFVTAGGGEIGRAQAVQAEAAGIAPTVDMNPVLLKPTSGSGCQVVVLGKVERNITSGDYSQYTPALLPTIEQSLDHLRAAYDIVVIEGAGSPAEPNLKDREIANMRIARMAESPVLLVGDIDKGGVFASLVGTLELLDEAERQLIKGFIINKFRGDLSSLKPALDFLEERTGRPVLGVVPYLRETHIAQEDSAFLDERPETQKESDLDIAVIRLPHIANYDDFDPLEDEDCRVRYVTQRFEMGSPHLIILPGTKSTVNDLNYLRQAGLAGDIIARARKGTPVIGICGGYQMLGRKIIDTQQAESAGGEVSGLGLLEAVTAFTPEKTTRQVRARVLADTGLLAGAGGQEIGGYEIHMGQTVLNAGTAAFRIFRTPQGDVDIADGALDARGTVLGTYLHGLFSNDALRQVLLNNLRRHWGLAPDAGAKKVAADEKYDKLAEVVRRSLDMAAIYRIMEGQA
jgi:adenosylcobyric acid synthase